MTTAEATIEELISLCKKGNRNAQYRIYSAYYKAMYNISLRIVKDSHWAEDVMQEAFLKAFIKLHTFKGEVTFGAWLKRIVINHSLDSYKKINTHENYPLDTVLYKTEDENNAEPPDLDVQLVKLEHIKAAIATLKDNYRIILTLLYIEGYDREEICEIMGITPGNCRTTISRAKESLLKKLAYHER